MPTTAPPVEADAVIIGAGPVGLFQVFELGLLEIRAHIIDALPQVGGLRQARHVPAAGLHEIAQHKGAGEGRRGHDNRVQSGSCAEHDSLPRKSKPHEIEESK